MENLPNDPLIEFHPDTLHAVRKIYNLDQPGAIKEAIDSFDAWIQKQNHFTKKDFNRDYLERTIIRSKGSVERAKEHLDKTCTSRTLVPHFFEKCDVRHPLLKDVEDIFLPKLTKDYYRIYLMQNNVQEFPQEFFVALYRRMVYKMEYICMHDYACGIIIVSDLRQMNLFELMKHINITDMGHILNLILVLEPTLDVSVQRLSDQVLVIQRGNMLDHSVLERLRLESLAICATSSSPRDPPASQSPVVTPTQVDPVCDEEECINTSGGYGFRLKGFYFITSSKIVDSLVTIIKQIVSKKIGERIQVLKNVEDLQDHVDKSILPEEYGGTEASMKELHKQWQKIVGSEKYKLEMDKINEAKTIEELRLKDGQNYQMGLPGTFRSLKVD